MAQVAIIGSGLAGLSAALFLARRGHQVQVFERDDDDLSTRAEGSWFRRGVGQASQTHVFLARSSAVMQEEAPDVLQALAAAGAYQRANPLLGAGAAQPVFERRLAYEAVLRDKVQRERGAKLVNGREVTGLAARAGEVPHVTGVRTTAGDVPADLVVDASGRRTQVGKWLAAIGAREAVHVAHPCGFFYLTRWYRLRPGAAFPDGMLPVPGRTHLGSFILCAAGSRQFSLSLGLSEREPLRHALRDPLLFDRFASSVPRLAAWLAVGEGIAEPQAFAGIENGRRRLVDAQGPVATGLALVGDSAVHTNPTLGRGTSLAFAHAQQLARAADQAVADPRAFITGFESWTDAHLGEWFDTQVHVDNEMTHRFHALAAGEPLPPLSARARGALAMQALAMEDAQVAGALTRLMNLLTRPSELAADAQLQQRIAALLERRPDLDEVREGASRADVAGWAKAAQ